VPTKGCREEYDKNADELVQRLTEENCHKSYSFIGKALLHARTSLRRQWVEES